MAVEPDDNSKPALIPVSDFKLPPTPVSQAARRSAADLVRRINNSIRRNRKDHESEIVSERISDTSEFAAASVETLLAEWTVETISDWLSGDPDDRSRPNVFSIVAPPFSGDHAWLNLGGSTTEFEKIDPPAVESLIDRKSAVKLPKNKPVFIAGLERFFVRHHNGLTLLRMLLSDIQRHPEPVLVSCSSWAWEYLELALPSIKQLPEPMTFQSASGEDLQNWLLNPNDGGELRVVDTEQAESVKGNTGNDETESDHEIAVLRLFSRLASYSRGNLGVAQAMWHRSLVEPAESAERYRLARNKTVVANVDLSEVARTTVGADKNGLLVLHELLVSNGSNSDRLELTLPIARSRIESALDVLQSSSLISHEQDRWSVNAIAYPAVRATLSNAGFTTDKF